MDAKPKRKYTVSEKVVAANRRNLEKANAVPKEIRYRSTPRREAASRQNLRKAASARRPASRPQRRPWSCRSLLRAARQWRQEALEYFQGPEEEREAAVAPEEDDANPAHVMRAMAECVGCWLVVARDQVDRERAGLLEIWQTAHRDAVSAAKLGIRLLGLFHEGKAFERVEVRLDRIRRTLREPWPDPTHPSAAPEEAPTGDLADPEEAPAQALDESPEEGKPREVETEPVAQTSVSEVCGLSAGTLQTADLNTAGPPSPTSLAFPPDFEGYCRLVEQSLGAAGAGLKGAPRRDWVR